MQVISVDPEIMHGAPCFVGTRVPITALLDHLPDKLEDFYRGFPTVERHQVAELLKQLPKIIAKVPPHLLLTA